MPRREIRSFIAAGKDGLAERLRSGYGYQWWTRDNGSFSAIGIHGQVIHVDPARGLVIALNSATAEASPSPASMQIRLALFDAIRAAVDAEPPAVLKPR